MNVNVNQRRKGNVHEGLKNTGSRANIDQEMRDDKVYSYLCYFQEAMNWVCSVIGRKINSIEEFEMELSKGNILAELALKYAPEAVKKIYENSELQYRHTDNLNYFINSLRIIGLPENFYFGIVDCYERKNIPNVIFCLHALAHYLVKIGKGLKIEALWGQHLFSQKDIENKKKELKNVEIPKFSEIKQVISHETIAYILAPIIKKKVYVPVYKKRQLEIKKILEKELKELDELTNYLIQKIRDKLRRVHIHRIQRYLRTFLYKKAFDDVCFGNPSLFSVKKFLFVLDQNLETLEIEKQIDDYHIKIKEKLKENYLLEFCNEQMEISIGLLMNNKVSITKMAKNKPNFDDVLSIYPLETPEYKEFQEFFYYIQTKPQYISNLLTSIKKENAEEFIYDFIIPLFYYTKTESDEYMIHKLIETLFQREIDINDKITLEGLLTTKLVTTIFRQNYKKFGELFGDVIEIIKQNDVCCDPYEISNQLKINSKNRIEALKKPEIQNIYKMRLKNMIEIVDKLLATIEGFITEISYSVRYYLLILNSITIFKKYVPTFFFSEFIMPFILAPDIFCSENYISKNIRIKCLEITKFVSNALKNDLPDFYYPINDFSMTLKERFLNIINRIVDIDEYFTQNNEFRIQKPIVQFSGRDANKILGIFRNNIEKVTDSNDKFYKLVVNSNPLKYKNDNPITFFLNCITEEDDKSYGDLKKRVVELILKSKSNEKLNNKNDFYELILNSNLKDEFKELELKGIVSESKRYLEFLKLLSEDIMKINSCKNQKIKELEINKKTYENVIKRKEYLEKLSSEFEDFFNTYTEQIIVKKTDDNSKYGKYSYDFYKLASKNVVKNISEFKEEQMKIYLTCNNPNIFLFEVFANKIKVADYELKLDCLLKMKYKKELSIKVGNVVLIYVDGIVDLINENYFVE